jgi:hypothetical protein
MTEICAAKTRGGSPCRRPSGWGTQHVGKGRCKLHGGNAGRPIVTGRYAHSLKESLKTKLTDVQGGDPLDLLPELEVQRVLLSEYLSRFQGNMNLAGFDIDFMMGWAAEIGRTVERMVKMKNDTALTQAEVKFLAVRIVELVGKYISDPSQRRAFVHELLTSVPALADGDTG